MDQKDPALSQVLQGIPYHIMQMIAAKAVAFGEAFKAMCKDYVKAVVDNASALANRMIDHGDDCFSGGSHTHLMLVDMGSKDVKINVAKIGLHRAGITCSNNSVPFDTENQ